MTRKKIGKLVLAGTGALAAAGMMAASVAAPMELELWTLELTTAEVTYVEQGTCIYESNLEIYPPYSGEVLEVLVEEGQPVKKGDPLAILSATDVAYQIQRLESEIDSYNAQAYSLALSERKEQDILAGSREELLGQMASVQARLEEAQGTESSREAQMALQKRMVDQDRDMVSLARQGLRNYREDYGRDNSDSDYLQMKAEVIAAERNLAASEQALEVLLGDLGDTGYYEGQAQSLQAQIDSVEERLSTNYGSAMQGHYAALVESARISIRELEEKQGRAVITAPCDGVVSSLPVQNLLTVTGDTVVATVGQGRLVEVFVPVREIDGVQLGDRVDVTVGKRAGDEAVFGAVAQIDSQAQVRLSPLGVEESRVRVLVRADDAVKVGYQADVKFAVYREEDCLTVPQKALFEMDGQDSVWVVRDGAVQVQPVEKGVETGGSAIIAKGLGEGDVVVADANIQGLKSGKRVTDI